MVGKKRERSVSPEVVEETIISTTANLNEPKKRFWHHPLKSGGRTPYQIYAEPNPELYKKMGVHYVSCNVDPSITKLKFITVRKFNWNMVKHRRRFAQRKGLPKKKRPSLSDLARKKVLPDNVEGKNLLRLADQMEKLCADYLEIAHAMVNYAKKVKKDNPEDAKSNIFCRLILDSLCTNVKRLLEARSKMSRARKDILALHARHQPVVKRIVRKYRIRVEGSRALPATEEGIMISNTDETKKRRKKKKKRRKHTMKEFLLSRPTQAEQLLCSSDVLLEGSFERLQL